MACPSLPTELHFKTAIHSPGIATVSNRLDQHPRFLLYNQLGVWSRSSPLVCRPLCVSRFTPKSSSPANSARKALKLVGNKPTLMIAVGVIIAMRKMKAQVKEVAKAANRTGRPGMRSRYETIVTQCETCKSGLCKAILNSGLAKLYRRCTRVGQWEGSGI